MVTYYNIKLYQGFLGNRWTVGKTFGLCTKIIYSNGVNSGSVCFKIMYIYLPFSGFRTAELTQKTIHTFWPKFIPVANAVTATLCFKFPDVKKATRVWKNEIGSRLISVLQAWVYIYNIFALLYLYRRTNNGGTLWLSQSTWYLISNFFPGSFKYL